MSDESPGGARRAEPDREVARASAQLARLAALPLAARHLRAAFGPATLRLAGGRALLDLDDGRLPRLRLSWTDAAGERSGGRGETSVGPRLADLLRTTSSATFGPLGRLAVPAGGRITDKNPAPPAVPREVRATAEGAEVRLAVTVGAACREVSLDLPAARGLAAVLDAWALLPARAVSGEVMTTTVGEGPSGPPGAPAPAGGPVGGQPGDVGEQRLDPRHPGPHDQLG
ncbi:hypothetical protein I6A84_00145 [Frankia sp. CNm7]|uniref:hypothetical protein n=1 Tax=Frankia nepalensis TaxID=1836974 RepID=UPI00193387D4|nr:hypothetical protein [Frankia nepalensis]MBL7516574.1 hypothetical protein [Frankia nepalensis]